MHVRAGDGTEVGVLHATDRSTDSCGREAGPAGDWRDSALTGIIISPAGIPLLRQRSTRKEGQGSTYAGVDPAWGLAVSGLLLGAIGGRASLRPGSRTSSSMASQSLGEGRNEGVMIMKMRMPMLIATGMTATLLAANVPHHVRFVDPNLSKSSTTAGPRAGNSECAPTDATPNDARLTCPQNRPIEQPHA